MLDPAFVPLMAFLQSKLPTVKAFIILTDRQSMPQHSKLRDMLCYEDLIQARKQGLFCRAFIYCYCVGHTHHLHELISNSAYTTKALAA